MAKVPFSKLQANLKADMIECSYNNKNNEPIIFEVKTYLPFEKKLELVSNVINQSIDDNGFYNPMRIKLFMTLEIVYAYTNLNFTDKMKEEIFKLYDILISTGIYNNILDIIKDEYDTIKDNIYDTIENIYKYKNSIMGILEAVSANYSDLNLNLDTIQNKLADPNSLSLIKEIMPLTNANMVQDI